MKDIIITGASRGIGRALVLALAGQPPFPARLILSARDEGKLRQVAETAETAGARTLCVPGDLSTIASARSLGERLCGVATTPAMLVHNAGVWPSRRNVTADGLELAYAVNFACPLVLQQLLLERRCLDRVMVISAGLVVKGRFSLDRTPIGLDFSFWRTYCNTKLAFAIAEREAARQHPDVDFLVLHPGVVRTDLVRPPGLAGLLLRLATRFVEQPEVCGARLRDLFEQDRWSPAGNARWLFKAQEQPWPAVTDDEPTRQAVLQAASAVLMSTAAVVTAQPALPR